MADDLVRALGLVLVIEGLLPFAIPGRWRETLRLVAGMEERHLRLMGLAAMLAGVAVLQLA